MQPATQAWGFAAVRLLGTVVIGCGAGWLFGNPFGGLAAALALHLAWVLANLARLEWWLRHRSYADPPDIGGVWGEIIAQIVRLHRRKGFHKQRFVQLMRQLQRSTAALPNGVVILNAQREIVWFNRMAARLLGLRRTADLGMRIENLLREPQFVRYLARQDFTNPVVIRPMTGEDCYLSLQVVPYGDGQLLLLVSDVSRQMRLEAVRRSTSRHCSHCCARTPWRGRCTRATCGCASTPAPGSSATSRRSTRPFPTWSTMPPSTPRSRARSRCAGGWMRTAVISR